MDLIKFLNMASSAELMALIVQWAGYGIALIVIFMLLVLVVNATRWQRKTIR